MSMTPGNYGWGTILGLLLCVGTPACSKDDDAAGDGSNSGSGTADGDAGDGGNTTSGDGGSGSNTSDGGSTSQSGSTGSDVTTGTTTDTTGTTGTTTDATGTTTGTGVTACAEPVSGTCVGDVGGCASCSEGSLVHPTAAGCPAGTWCCVPYFPPNGPCQTAGGVCAHNMPLVCPTGWLEEVSLDCGALALSCCMPSDACI